MAIESSLPGALGGAASAPAPAGATGSAGPTGPGGSTGPGGPTGPGGAGGTVGTVGKAASRRGRANRRHRDRRGRGLRGELAPPEVPLARTRGEEFDDLILDAVEALERTWAAELADVEFAVEEVPQVPASGPVHYNPEVIDDNGIPLGRLVRPSAAVAHPVIVIYRRPLETRAIDREDRADLVYSVVAELVAEALGKDVDEIG